MRVRIRDKAALLVGDGLEPGAAIAAALATNGARLTRAAEFRSLDLAVLFLQDAAMPVDRLAGISRDVAAAMGEGGRILNVVSVTGLVPMRGDDSAPPQAAAIAFTRSLALELGPRGILVNALAIAPGLEASRRMVSHTPGGRTPSPAAIADAALFLLDPDNSYMTGHVMVADGGWSIGYGRDF